MGWAETHKLYTALYKKMHGDGQIPENLWQELITSIERLEGQPPYHLQGLLREIERVRGERAKDEIAILEHGCGGGQVGLILFLLGYRRVYGVDIDKESFVWNAQLKRKFNDPSPHFFKYDGQTLPFHDSHFDFVFSQQVLEHVAPNQIDAYYREEARVLKPGGVAFHEVPHRLVPYDSHTKSWFIHYLPRSSALLIYRILKRNVDFVERWLFLRWPHDHIMRARKYIGETKNLTNDRLQVPIDANSYNGYIGIRKFIGCLARIPIIGALVRPILGSLIMLETRSIKPTS